MKHTYRKTTLGNGIRVVSEKMNLGRAVSIGVWIASGSRHEPRRQNGISHLLEHMLFKGTHSRSAYDIAVSLESVGGHLNAFTEREATCYYALVLDDNLPEAVDVLSDIVQNGVMAEHDLESEKDIVFEEMQTLADTPEDFIQDCFIQSMFDHHALGQSTLGSHQAVRRLKRDDLVDYHRRVYTSGNIIVAAAGRCDHDRLVGLVEKHFPIQTNGTMSKHEPIRMGKRAFHRIRSNIKQSHICTGAQTVSYKDPMKYALVVLNTVLGGGMSSRLFQSLREKRGLAYTVYSFFELWSDTGLLGVYTGTSLKNRDEALKRIEEELTLLCDRPIPMDECNRTKSQLKRNLILTMEDCTNRMNRLVKREMYDEPHRSIDETLTFIDSVTPEDVQSLARQLFRQQDRYTTILEPRRKP